MKLNDKDRGWVDVDEEKKRTSENASFEVNGETFTPYAISKTYIFPVWLKACFAKWWFPGMIYYFIYFGFAGGVTNQDILALILGLLLGVVNDIFLNHYFRDFSSPNHDYKKYIICGRKSSMFISLPINIIVGIVISFLSAFMINLVVYLCLQWGIIATSDSFLFAVGALFFATFAMLFDLLIVLMRNLIEKLIKKIKSSKTITAPPDQSQEN